MSSSSNSSSSKKPNKPFSLTPSEEIMIDKIYDEMRQSLRRVVGKYMNMIKIGMMDKDNSSTGSSSSSTIFYPMYIFLAEARLVDDLVKYNRIMGMVLNEMTDNMKNHNSGIEK